MAVIGLRLPRLPHDVRFEQRPEWPYRIAQVWGGDVERHKRLEISEHFNLATDAFFIEKLRDVVGLYLSPPDNALVLCVDEKSQCQALERTQPMLPLGLGYVEGVHA